jgi:chromosome segregation ATPase
MLFAEVEAASGLAYAGIGALVTTLIGAVIGGVIKLSNHWNASSTKKRKDTISELHDMMDQMRKDGAEDRRQIVELRDDLTEAIRRENDCRTENARAVARIEALEEACMNAGIKFRPWSKEGSAAHAALPSQQPKSPGG